MRTPPRGLLAIQGFRGFQCALLCDGVRIFENSPSSTEVWLRYASPQVASLINGVDDRRAVNERRRSRSVFPRSGTSLAGGERPIDQKPSRCDGLTRNHKISSRKEPPVAYANRPRCEFDPSRTDHVAKSTRRAMRTSPRGLLAIQRFRGFRCALLCDGVRIFGDLPPSTEVWLRYASPQVASLINGVDDHKAVNERRRSRSVFPRSGTSLAGGERPIDQKPSRCDGLTRNHKISSRKEPPEAHANRPLANLTHREPTTLRNRHAPQCDRLSGGSLLSNGFGGFDARCYAMAFAFLKTHPRLQRCGCATLRHKSLRSLTARSE